VAQFVVALRYKPEGMGAIPYGVIDFILLAAL
jgi:hypothetical protein